MINQDLIPRFNSKFNSKCEIYAGSNKPRKSFMNSDFRNAQLLELIYNNICDFNRVPIEAFNFGPW